MSQVTDLLDKARTGDDRAWEQAVTLVYDDLKRIARGMLGGGNATLNPTALVHECYLRLERGGADAVQNRAHFLSLAARAMRQLMLNHARGRLAEKRGAGAAHTTLDDDDAAVTAEAASLIDLDRALQQLECEDARLVRIVECRVFAGLSEQETADASGESLRTTQRLWADARGRLAQLLAD